MHSPSLSHHSVRILRLTRPSAGAARVRRPGCRSRRRRARETSASQMMPIQLGLETVAIIENDARAVASESLSCAQAACQPLLRTRSECVLRSPWRLLISLAQDGVFENRPADLGHDLVVAGDRRVETGVPPAELLTKQGMIHFAAAERLPQHRRALAETPVVAQEVRQDTVGHPVSECEGLRAYEAPLVIHEPPAPLAAVVEFDVDELRLAVLVEDVFRWVIC